MPLVTSICHQSYGINSLSLSQAGEVSARPCIIAPLDLPLDWSLWFVPLGDVNHHPWFFVFLGTSAAVGARGEILSLSGKAWQGALLGLRQASLQRDCGSELGQGESFP